MRLAAVLACAILIIGFGVGAGHADKRVALVIGNGAYERADRLANPVIDARRMRDKLKTVGFDVVFGENLGKLALERTIGDFADAAQDADVALVYFAGHGATFGDVPYVVPVDARFASLAAMPYELVPVEMLIGELRRAKGVRIAILDACRDNTAERNLKRVASRGGETTRGLARVKNPEGLILAYATQYLATAADGPTNQDSPFTAALLDNIATPGLDVKELFFRVGSEVIAKTKGEQRPEISVSFYDRYTLVPALPTEKPSAAAPAPTPAISEAERAWAEAKDSKSPAVLEEFIKRYGDSFYAALARARLEELKKTQVAVVAPPAPATVQALSREAALGQSPRIAFENYKITGSISLRGGRIDDLSLLKAPDAPKPLLAIVLTPAHGPDPVYVEFGWLASTGTNIKLPDAGTIWKQEGTGGPGNVQPVRLSFDRPVTLTYDNGAGLEFRRTMSLDDGYMFTARAEVINRGAAAVTLFPYALISRHGTRDIPQALHPRFIGVLGSKGLQEFPYATMAEKKSLSFDGTGDWLGIAEQDWTVRLLLPDSKEHVKAHFSADTSGQTRIYQADYLLDGVTITRGATGVALVRVFAGPEKDVAPYLRVFSLRAR